MAGSLKKELHFFAASLILLDKVSQSINIIAQSLTKSHFLTDLDDGEYCMCYDGGVEVTGLLVA